MLETRSLTKRYGEITALAELDLTIGRGCVFGYIGHNGAGKTTTIRILAGLLRATSGSARIAGVDVTADHDQLKSLVGYLPDDFGVYEQMRVWEYLDFFGAAFRIPRRQRKQRIEDVFDITGAGYMRDRFVDTLSKGMRQRVGVARTLMHDPQVLLLDEPANGLDPRARIEMRELIRRLADDGKTVLVSSHILPELASVCDLVGIIHQGRLQAAGPIDQVLGQIARDRLMELRTLGADRVAAEVLARCDDAGDVQPDEQIPGLLRFHFGGDDQALSALLAGLVEAEARVVTLREVPLSLEDAFMAMSGIDSGQGEPDTDAAQGQEPTS